jgi:hypothetical protein
MVTLEQFKEIVALSNDLAQQPKDVLEDNILKHIDVVGIEDWLNSEEFYREYPAISLQLVHSLCMWLSTGLLEVKV